MIEERGTQLEGVRHRGEVRFQQEVTRKVRLEVEQLEPGDAAARRFEQDGPGKAGIAPEAAPKLERKDLHQAAVTLAAGRCSDIEKTGGPEEGRPWLAPGGRQKPQRRGARSRDRRRDAPCDSVRDVTLIARKRLVASVAGERDRDVPARLLRDEERRKRRFVPERLVLSGRRARKCWCDGLLHRELSV